MKKYIAIILTALLLCGCGRKMESSISADREYSENGYGAVADSYIPGETVASASAEGIRNQKLIRTVRMDVETDDMDPMLASLEQTVATLGGYMENKTIRNGGASSTRRYRYADMVIRIPVENLDSFLSHVQGASNVVSFTESADDITLTYIATESRVAALETEQQRLLELLSQAENMSDLLQIEARLTDVRAELEEVASTLRLYDNLVDYGTVELSITEVQEFTVVEEETVWQRIGSGIANSWRNLWTFLEDLFVFAIVSLPYLIPIGFGAGLTWAVVSVVYKKTRKKQKPQKPEQE